MTAAARLGPATLRHARGTQVPAYRRDDLVPGIVHFGPGAFHRAHQAVYLDTVLASDPRWAISAVALNTTDVSDALRPQGGLYTLAILDAETRFRVIGSLAEFLTRDGGAAITARIAAPTTRLVTATVTEKGYSLTPDGTLDHNNPAIRHDLARPDAPRSFIGRLVAGLAARRAAGSGGLTVLACDNLTDNGRRLARAVGDFAEARDGDLARWIADEVRFPSSMVDSITPATDDLLRERVARETGLRDAWPIQRERFTQWVIEDGFAGDRPPLEAAGVQLVASVTAWEDAKLRLLNGAHSTLAYLGLLLGHELVGDAMRDPALAGFVERLMREDIAATLSPTPGLDPAAYVGDILDRFRNPAIRHRLGQIAWDGSQKLPFRLVATMGDARAAGRPIDRLAIPIAAWFRFLALDRPPAPPLVDPMADRLVPLARSGDIAAMVAGSGIFPPLLAGDSAVRVAIATAHRALGGPAGLRDLIA